MMKRFMIAAVILFGASTAEAQVEDMWLVATADARQLCAWEFLTCSPGVDRNNQAETRRIEGDMALTMSAFARVGAVGISYSTSWQSVVEGQPPCTRPNRAVFPRFCPPAP